jgi:hypothetical protein
LVSAYRLFQKNDPSAADSMRAFLATHPHDADAWNLLGESQYHSRELYPREPEALYAPFDSVLAIDPSLTPSLIHPMEVALFSHDSVRFARYLALAKEGAGASELQTFETMQRIGFVPGADTLLRRIQTPNQGLLFASVTGTYHDPTTTPARIRGHLLSFVERNPPGPQRDQMLVLLAATYAGLGQLDSVDAVATSMMARNNQLGQFLRLAPAMYGMLDPAAQRAMKDRMVQVVEREQSAFARMATVTIALQDGDVAAARRLLAPVLRPDTMALAPDARFIRPFFIAQQGWADVLAGDTTGGLVRMKEGITGMMGKMGPPLRDAIRFQYALTLAARPVTRAEGMTFLAWGFTDSPTYSSLGQLALGRTREAAGDREGAIDAYSQFNRLFADADSGLQSRAAEARDALARLAAEPGGR